MLCKCNKFTKQFIEVVKSAHTKLAVVRCVMVSKCFHNLLCCDEKQVNMGLQKFRKCVRKRNASVYSIAIEVVRQAGLECQNTVKQ